MLKLVVLHQCESKGESSVQEWGFSPVWVNMWSLRSPARPHDLLQRMYTLVQLLSTVGKHVIFQIASQTEWFASRQFLQSSSITELFVASVTFVWLLSSVGEHVSSQISSLIEWFVANGTLMWLFFSVCHHVFPQNFSSIHVHHHAIYLVNLHVNHHVSRHVMLYC